MAAEYARVNPRILTWARERARLSASAMAGKMSVPEQRLVAWENGQAMPTFRQARIFAHKAHVPFGYFYLDKPPGIKLPLPDLRTVGSCNLDEPSAELIEIIQVMQQRQSWYREYLLAQGEGPNKHVGRFGARITAPSGHKSANDFLGHWLQRR